MSHYDSVSEQDSNGKGKLPALHFYPGDWAKDPGIQALTITERAIWFEILLLMHESNERGVLLLNGKPMPEQALARILRVDCETLTKALNNLKDYGVCSIREDGAVYCRRMIRDEAYRQTQKKSGKLGGNPALVANYNTPGFVYLIRRESDNKIKIGISVNPSKRIYTLRYKLKESLELIAASYVKDMGAEEAALHEQYKHVKDGEWFSLAPNELNTLIDTLKGRDKGQTDIPEDESENEVEDLNLKKNSQPPGPPLEQRGKHIRMLPDDWLKLQNEFGNALKTELSEADRWIEDNKTCDKNARKYARPTHNHYLFFRGWLRRNLESGPKINTNGYHHAPRPQPPPFKAPKPQPPPTPEQRAQAKKLTTEFFEKVKNEH